MAGHFEHYWFLVHEVVLLERLCEVDLGAYLLGLHCLHFCLGVLYAVAHLSQLLNGAFEASYFHVLILFGRIRVFYIRVAAGIPYSHCQRKPLAVDVLLYLTQLCFTYLHTDVPCSGRLLVFNSSMVRVFCVGVGGKSVPSKYGTSSPLWCLSRPYRS